MGERLWAIGKKLMARGSWLIAETEVGNGSQPFRSAVAVGRGPRTRRFPDCSGIT